MNLRFAFEKATLIFVVFYYATIFTVVEAERSVRVIKTKLPPSPLRIHFSGGPTVTSYARRYGYGRPGPSYNFHGKNIRNNNYFEKRNRKTGPKNYAHEFANWSPNRYQGGKFNQYNTRADNGRRGHYKPYPPARKPPFKNPNPRPKVRPQKASHLQRPQPPIISSEFDEEYFFPEEAVKAESKYEYEFGHPKSKKKRRNPGDEEKGFRRPDSKSPHHTGGRYGKQKTRDTVTAFTSFGPRPSNEEEDDDYDEVQDYVQQGTKNKKKKIKKKTHSRKKTKDEYQYDQDYSSDTSAYDDDTTERSSRKRVKKQPFHVKDNEDKKYGGISGGSGLSGFDENYNAYNQINQKPHDASQFSPTYQQSWSQIAGTTQRSIPYNTINNNNHYNNPNLFQSQQFVPNQYTNIIGNNNNNNPYQNAQNQYNYQNFAQKPQIIAGNQQSNFYSQPDNYYNRNVIFGTGSSAVGPVASASAPSTISANNYPHSQLPSDKTKFSGVYSNAAFSSNGHSTYSQQATGFGPTSQNYHSQYNNNANGNNYNNGNVYVKNQSLSYLDNNNNSNNQKYSNRFSVTYQTGTGPSDAETDFIKKHQSLYHKGLTGVPVQGDGYKKDATKGDYDIGYGDFQFDENPST